MKFHVIIPARLDSSRLPGKVLLDLAGKTLIEHVHHAAQASGAASVTIATDSLRVKEAVEGFGGRVCMTRADHRSGSDRLGEAVIRLGLDDDALIVNVQGDEPGLAPALVKKVAETLTGDLGVGAATACFPLSADDDPGDPHLVKVVCDARGRALYFSRAPIAVSQGGGSVQCFGHLGVYAYRAGFLRRFCTWERCALEDSESLEQLRILWHGEAIAVHVSDRPAIGGVDTPADLERARRFFAEQGTGP